MKTNIRIVWLQYHVLLLTVIEYAENNKKNPKLHKKLEELW